MIEKWRSIIDYPDYQVSNFGRVRRISTASRARRWKSLYVKKPQSNGRYLTTWLYNEHSGKKVYIHRLVLTVFARPARPGEEGNHGDGDRSNNRIDNLEWLTPSQNMYHAFKTGLRIGKGSPGRVGELHPLCRLRNGEVYLIKKLLNDGRISRSIIAKMFKLAKSTISKIHLGKRWGHIVFP